VAFETDSKKTIFKKNMISKFGIGILATAAMFLFAAPVTSFAATSDSTKKQIKKYEKKLKALPNAGAAASVVNKYVTKLAKLDPKKANKWYKLGLQKLIVDPNSKANAEKLAKDVTKIVKKSGLSDKDVKKIDKQVNKTEDKYNPYIAFINSDLVGSLA
jgi:hypothetical protein